MTDTDRAVEALDQLAAAPPFRGLLPCTDDAGKPAMLAVAVRGRDVTVELDGRELVLTAWDAYTLADVLYEAGEATVSGYRKTVLVWGPVEFTGSGTDWTVKCRLCEQDRGRRGGGHLGPAGEWPAPGLLAARGMAYDHLAVEHGLRDVLPPL